jgi:hypothetical protein
MRFGKPIVRPPNGRIESFLKFLWFPKCGANGVVRWLEWAYLVYRYERSCYDEDEWVFLRFEDE